MFLPVRRPELYCVPGRVERYLRHGHRMQAADLTRLGDFMRTVRNNPGAPIGTARRVLRYMHVRTTSALLLAAFALWSPSVSFANDEVAS